ncbi:GIP, partial [Symbiodinium sp. CCMP2456]
MYAWESSCNAMQMQMTNLKLHALGLKQIARICQVLTSLMVCGWVVCCAIAAWIGDLEGQRSQKTSSDVLREDAMRAFAWIGVACTLLGLPLQFLGLCVAAGRALSVGWHDSDIRHAACLLYVNSTLQLLGPILSMRATIVFTNATVKIVDWQNPQQTSGTMLLTLDMTLQVLNVLLLSGLIGPQQWQNPMAAFQKLATLQGFGLTSTKRIAFSGRVNETARDCIVSFPGKYSEEWDQAVSVAKTQEAISLACVFLTDRASGLGVHCENPDSPGECWCRAIYGSLPASTYISVVDMRPEMQDSQAPIDLEFKLADALAMGQCLVRRKAHHGEFEWRRKLADAEEDARARCAANRGRAPWGCRWFEDWRRNVHKAVELQQTLHVFYFEDRKGQGKMKWQELPSEKAKARVRRRSGLGASQTAEVAYLDKE